MNRNPLISIVVPVYKVEKYIHRCVNSLIQQSYRNLEIILVDDGSPDNCGKICDELALSDVRIKVLHKKNGGISDARNKGIDLATGEYIGFVDSDDYLHPQMYEILLNNLLNCQADMSVCSFLKVGDSFLPGEIKRLDPNVFSNVEALGILNTFLGVNLVVVWNKLYDKKLFEELRYPVGRHRGEDESVIHKLIFYSKKVAITEQKLYFYYQNEQSLMHTRSLVHELDYANAIDERIAFYAEKRLTDLQANTIKRYCLWILSTLYTQTQQKKNDSMFIEELNSRLLRNLAELKNHPKAFPLITVFAYKLARRMPVLFGFLAFNKLYRKNILSKVASVLFSDFSN